MSNIGNGDAKGFKVAFYLSEDGITVGELLTTVNVKSLGAGMTKDCSFKYASKSSLSGKYIIAVVDSGNQVSESNEDNNRAVARIP